MGEEKEVSLEKCINYTKGVALIAKNELLEPGTMYKLGRLSDYATSPVRNYEKVNRTEAIKVNDQIKSLHEKIRASKSDEEKFDLNEEIKKIKSEHHDKMTTLLENVEKVKIPSFKLSEFIAKADKPDKGITTGQSLVPQEFFTLLGDIIDDDKSK